MEKATGMCNRGPYKRACACTVNTELLRLVCNHKLYVGLHYVSSHAVSCDLQWAVYLCLSHARRITQTLWTAVCSAHGRLSRLSSSHGPRRGICSGRLPFQHEPAQHCERLVLESAHWLYTQELQTQPSAPAKTDHSVAVR